MAKPYLNGHILAALELRLLINQAAKWVTFRQKRKHFFFEKKKQKTFEFLNAPVQAKETQETKVFWFFFSKKNIFLSLLRI